MMIRPASREDIRLLEEWLPANPPSLHVESVAAQGSGAVTYLVAWEGRRPVGGALLRWPVGPAREREAPAVVGLGIAPDARLRGLGSALLAHLEALARDRGHRTLAVARGAGRGAERLERFYVRYGYSELAGERVEQRVRVGPRGERILRSEHVVLLVKRLS